MSRSRDTSSDFPRQTDERKKHRAFRKEMSCVFLLLLRAVLLLYQNIRIAVRAELRKVSENHILRGCHAALSRGVTDMEENG